MSYFEAEALAGAGEGSWYTIGLYPWAVMGRRHSASRSWGAGNSLNCRHR